MYVIEFSSYHGQYIHLPGLAISVSAMYLFYTLNKFKCMDYKIKTTEI